LASVGNAKSEEISFPDHDLPYEPIYPAASLSYFRRFPAEHALSSKIHHDSKKKNFLIFLFLAQFLESKTSNNKYV